jgi:tetratricopeptide (TPR) repeat protein
MPTQPAELADLLFDRLIRAVDQGMQGIPDELEIRRLERDAAALLKADPLAAHQILGGIAALRWEVERMRSHHEAALRYRPTAQVYRNYATSLQLVGMFPDAANNIRIASEKQPENLTLLHTAGSFALWAGNVTEALQLELELEKRNPDHVSGTTKALKSLLGVMERHSIRERDVQDAWNLAFELLREKKQRFSHIGMEVDDDQDAAFLTIHPEASTKEVLALDKELGRRFADRFPDLSSALVVQYEPAPPQIAPRANDRQAARPA